MGTLSTFLDNAREVFSDLLLCLTLFWGQQPNSPCGLFNVIALHNKRLSAWWVAGSYHNFKIACQEVFSNRSTDMLGTIVPLSARISTYESHTFLVVRLLISLAVFSESRTKMSPTWNSNLFYFLSDAHKVLHIKSGTSFHPLVGLVKRYQTQEILSTFAHKGRKILATYPSVYKRGLLFPSEMTVSNISEQLARKRERNGEANYFCVLAKGHFKLCAHDIIMFMVNIIVGDSECMAWEAGRKKKKKASISDRE